MLRYVVLTSSKYPGQAETRRKFDQVSAEYAGSARPLMVEMLHWRARRYAEIVIRTLYVPATPPGSPVGTPLASALHHSTIKTTQLPRGLRQNTALSR